MKFIIQSLYTSETEHPARRLAYFYIGKFPRIGCYS